MAMIQVVDTNHKDLGKKDVKVCSDECGPYRVDYEGREYRPTGKSGNDMKTGKPSIEMATEDDQRLWISTDETLINLD